MECYEWNPAEKDFKRWNPALKEFASYHRGRLSKAFPDLKNSEISKKVIREIERLDDTPAMATAKKLALQIENGKLQTALMEESMEDATIEVHKTPRKNVEIQIPDNVSRKLKKIKSEDEEDRGSDEYSEDDYEEDDEDGSEEDEDDDDEEEEEESDYEDKQIDVKINIVHSNQTRGFSIKLNTDGLNKILSKLQQDYGDNLNLFYRDDDGDIVTILSVDDLLYAYRTERKQHQKGNSRVSPKKLKLKLFAERNSNHNNNNVNVNGSNSQTAAFLRGTNSLSSSSSVAEAKQVFFDGEETAKRIADRDIFSSPTSYYVEGKNPDSFDILWKKGEVLGVGSFGKVFAGLNLANGVKMAIKEVYIHSSKNAKQQVKALQREVAILGKLDHPNIIKYLGTEFSGDTLRIFLELANEGSLKDSLREFGKFLLLIISVLSLLGPQGLSPSH